MELLKNINKMNLKSKFKKLCDTGFFSIFVSNVFSKVIALLGGIVLVRILSQKDYGIYAYAINAMTILYLLNDFGASTAALQYLTESRENKNRQKLIIKFAFKIGFIGACFSGCLILLSPIFYPFQIQEAKNLTPILCMVPILNNISLFISAILRANLKNNRYAIIELSKTFFNYVSLIICSIFFGLIGAIISQYIYIILGLVLGIILSRDVIGNTNNKNESLSKKDKKEFINFSITTQLNSTISGILLNIDIFLIGIVIGTSTSVALYKVASTIPMALSFLPTCVMIYILPYFIMHKDDFQWIKKTYKKLIKYGMLGYGFISFCFIVFAKVLFEILYTDIYNEAILPFQILIIGFFFSATFKIPTNNIIYSMRKVKINLIFTVISAISNFVLNIFFIKKWGITGAAITTTIINIVSSILLMIYVKKIIKDGERNEKNNS